MLLRYVFFSLPFAFTIPVDNDVVDEPEIECGGDAIGISFKTRNPFNGHLYVKGRFDDVECKNEQIGRTFTGITLHAETCGMTRLRSLNPRGIFASITIVISFHPQFVTKVDRVYNIQCFYMEADKTLEQQLEVAELTTAFVSAPLPMPMCQYEILSGGPDGSAISFALVGQQVYHKWTCDTETHDTFCMVVHSCFVDDGRGNKVDMIDTNGCAVDKYLLGNLEYPTDLMAAQEAHIFKYADRSALFFQCQISITLKEQGTSCVRPSCAEPIRGKRFAQSSWKQLMLADSVIDVASPRLETLDIFEMTSSSSSILEVSQQILQRSRDISSLRQCISTTVFVVVTLSAITILIGTVIGLFSNRSRHEILQQQN